MKTIKTIIKDTKKKAFTLIELLIVVAIIGILAGVGVPMYNGYMATAKVKSTQTNHGNTTSFIAATLTKCATGVDEVTMGSTKVKCSSSPAVIAKAFATYLNSINKNPYNTSKPATVYTSATPILGQSSVYGYSNKIRVKTNVGNESGASVLQPISGWDEITKE